MPDRDLVIHKQTPPSRCEICHQSDQLDLDTGECRRCAGLLLPTSQQPSHVSTNIGPSLRATLAISSVIAAFFPGLCFWPLGLVLSLIGIILGRIELRAIYQGRAHFAGEDLAKVGFYGGITVAIFSLLIGLMVQT
jgi:hypothetical protein